jgi:TPR repeat protein
VYGEFLVPGQGSAAFVSYSREDSEFALRLAQDLKAAGANVWLDQLELVPGRAWDNSIEDALLGAQQMLVILSPTSVKSENVRDEISYALKQGKTVIPVLYMECVIPLRLERRQHIDFRSDYAGGLAHLLKYLGVAQPDPTVLQKAAESDAQRQAAWQAREAQGQRLRDLADREREEADRKTGEEERQRQDADTHAQDELSRKQAAEREAQEQARLKERDAEAARVREAERQAETARFWEEQRQAEQATKVKVNPEAGPPPPPPPPFQPAPVFQQTTPFQPAPPFQPTTPLPPPTTSFVSDLQSMMRKLPGWAWAGIGVVLLVVVFAAGRLLVPPPTPPPAAPQQPQMSQADYTAIYNQATTDYNQKDYTNGLPLFDQACTGGIADSCEYEGYMYDYALGVSQDYTKAFALYSRACDAGSAAGCNQLGYMYDHAKGIAQDFTKAMALYLKACNGGSATGCNQVGNMYYDPKGVTQDYGQAIQFYTKACDQNYGMGCDNLGEMYRDGQGLGKDVVEARALFQKGCGLNEQSACDDLKKLQ